MMLDLLRGLLVIAITAVLMLSLSGVRYYWRSFHFTNIRFDAAVALTFVGVAGYALFVLLIMVGRIGEPSITSTSILAFLSTVALIFGLVGILVERGRVEKPKQHLWK